MSECLAIRLSSRSDQPVHWLVWSIQQEEIIASGQLSSIEQLSELTSYAQQRTVFMLLPSNEMLLTEVALPKGSARHLGSTLPYLLEEELAQEVEQLHIHLLEKEQDLAYVAVVDHQKMQVWRDAISQASINVKQWIPDCLCLPVETQGYSALELDGQWLIRQREYLGAAIELDWLSAWIYAQKTPLVVQIGEGDENVERDLSVDELDSNSTVPLIKSLDDSAEIDNQSELPTLYHYSPLPDGITGRWCAREPDVVMKLLTLGAMKSGVNLFSGRYQAQSSWKKHWQPWRKVAIAGGLLLAIFGGNYTLQVMELEDQALAYRTESERIFRQVLPQFKNIPTQSYLKRQISSELTKLGGSDTEEGLLTWLTRLQPLFAQISGMNYSQVRYDQSRQELRLQATAPEFQTFEQLRTILATQFAVEQGPLSKNLNRVNGSIVLRMKS